MRIQRVKLITFLFLTIALVLSAAQAQAASPTITSLSPTSGAVGASVTITGSNFGSTQGSSTVKFNGTAATVTSWSSTSIGATVPSGATTGNVVVTVSNRASNGVSFTVVAAPSITSLSITTGAVSAAVTITGANFGSSQGSSTVKFNGTTATVTSWSATSIGVTVPSGATTGSVVVHASGVDSNGSSFTVVAAPSITGLSITTGAVGAAVTITGTNFGSSQGSSTVKFNGTTATVTGWSATSIGVTVPSGATTGSVVVHASGVDSNGSSFTVAPNITSLSVTTGAVGAAVTITGTSFGASQGSSSATFNGTTATITSWSATSIGTTVPAGATTGNVVVTVSNVASNGSSFTVVAAPSITSLSITTGAVGAAVTITGANFGASQGSGSVTFNGTTATVSSWSATSIGVTVPSGATTGNVVVNASGVASNGVNFTVVVVVPNITSIAPTSGPVGTAVTIAGTNFGTSQGSSTISLNSTNAAVASWSETNIVAMVPTGATSGPLSVTVNGQSSNSSFFTVTTALPSGWSDRDIGSVGIAGSASYSAGTFTINSTGTVIDPTNDFVDGGFHFTYQSLSGDGTIIARVLGQQGGTSSDEAGVMIRESLSTNSTNMYVDLSNINNPNLPYAQIRYRPATGAYSSYASATTQKFYPYCLKLVRAGNSFSGYSSYDCINWELIASSSISMAQNVYVGLAVTSYSSTSAVTATFDSVSISSSAMTSPSITNISATSGSVGTQIGISGSNFGASEGNGVVTINGVPMTITSWSASGIIFTIPAGATSGPLFVFTGSTLNSSNPIYFTVTSQPLPTEWLDKDVGQAPTIGSATSSNGTFTVNGSGILYSTDYADGFNFAYQPLSSDGTIVARVLSLANADGYTNAGVMIRESFNPGSTYAAALIGRVANVSMLYRTSTGTAAGNAYGATGYFPYWVKLVRSGSTFSSYESADGVNWTAVNGTATINMAQNVYIGLCVSSGQSAGPVTATFDNVSINTGGDPNPVITSLSATTGAIGSQVTISGSNFGASQGSSVVMLHGSPLAINLWSSTSIVATIPTGATSGPLVVSVGPDANDSNPVYFTVTTQPLPVGWLDTDIGDAVIGGSATYANGTFTVNGIGVLYGGGTSGMFHLAYQPMPGDGSVVARVLSVQGGASYKSAGVIIQETLAPTTTFATTMSDNTPNTFLLYRTSVGTNPNIGYAGGSTSFPYWIKVVRTGSTFSGYRSADGVNWTQVGTNQTISMAQNVYAGLAVDSGSSSSTTTATFDNVSVTVGTTPYLSGMSPSLGGVGTSVTIAGSNFGATQGSSTITFNGAAATVTTWTSSQIVATVPAAVPSGAGPVSVTVNSIASVPIATFTAIKPVITSLAPPAAPIGGTVTLSGSGFGPSASGNQVLFNGTAATATAWRDTGITVTVPSSATSGSVSVVEDSYSSNSASFTVIESLSLSGLTPAIGPLGTTVTITGTGFGSTQSNSVASFYGAAANVVSWSDTSIVTTVPVGTSTGSVSVTVAGETAYGPIFFLTSSLTLTDSLGNTTTYNAQVAGGQWEVTNSQGSGCSSCTQRGTISETYDSSGNALTRTDELGHTITYTYDSNGNVLSISQPDGNGNTPTTSYTYNSFNEVLTVTDPLGNVTTNTYDANGNLLTVTTPKPNSSTNPSVTTFTYDSKGELLTIKDPLTNVTTLTYTTAGLIYTIKDAQNNITTYGYDTHGNRTSVTDALNHQTTLAYDTGDRLKTITYPDTTMTTFIYDSRGRRTSVTDQNGKTTTYAYDDADRLTSVTDAGNNVTTYGYDTENNLTSIKDANNNTTSFTPDAFGRITKTTFPSGYVETYNYDAVGNLTSKTDRKNQVIGYTYDQLNRLTQKSYPDTTTVNYTYDLDSRLTQVTDPTGTYQFTFDNMGRLTSASTSYAFLTARNFTTGYSYDAASNRTGFTDPESGSTAYAYDTLNRLQTLTPPTAFSGTGSFGFGYDALSRRTQMTRPNNVATNYAYDNLSRLQSVLHQLSGSTIDGATYTVDNAGNRTAKTDQRAGVTSNYGYDAIYELTGVTQGTNTTESYTYDPVGNRLSSLGVSPYGVNGSNELTSTPSASYTYDNNGNTLTSVTGSNTTTYAWDFENRLTSVTLPGSGGTVSFKYDPFGRRIYKSSSSGTSIYAYDGDNLIEETNSSGAVVARYSQGLNIDEPLAMLRSSTTSFYQADGLGSITSLSNAAGALAQTYSFDAFGKQTSSSGSLVNPFQYTGRELDSEANLYFLRNRYYDPATGRFLNEDPNRFLGGINLYRYVSNNPGNFVDPLGLAPSFSCACRIAAGALAGGVAGGKAGKWVGGALGGIGGALGGGAGGTLVEPGGGTIVGGIAGAAEGAAAGSRIGTGVGAVIGALVGALLADQTCKENQQKCKDQWIADIEWCDAVYGNDPTLHLACVQIADLNAERCLDGLPRLNPDPRWYRKRY